jgi:hypothetical protein
MADLIFPEHAWREMSRDSISEDEVYHVVGEADDVVVRANGRTVYTGTLDDGREVVVIVDDDGETVVTVWQWKRRRPRRR